MARAKPDLDWLPAARAALNGDPAFRKLGSADFSLGLVLGDQARLITFEAFEIADVADANPGDMRDADVVIEMAPKDWNAYLRMRAKGKGDSLLALDLTRHVVKAANPLKLLMLERYNRTIQALLDAVGAVSRPRTGVAAVSAERSSAQANEVRPRPRSPNTRPPGQANPA